MDSKAQKTDNNTVEDSLSDSERIELIANLILEIVSEELLRSDDKAETCKNC